MPRKRNLPRANFPHHVEAAYARILLARVDAFHQIVVGEVLDVLRQRTGVDERARRDSAKDDEHEVLVAIQRAGNQAKDHNPIRIDALTQLADRIDNHVRRTLERQLSNVPGLERLEFSEVDQERLDRAAARGADLIRSLDERYLDDVQEVVIEGIRSGATIDAISSSLQERTSVSGSRAKLIARDQVASVGRGMTQARHEELGITEYEWGTVGDERVRPACKANNGKTFKWSEGDGGEHPGDRIQCRCQAKPILPARASRGVNASASNAQSVHAPADDRLTFFNTANARVSDPSEAEAALERWENNPLVPELRRRLSQRSQPYIREESFVTGEIREKISDAQKFYTELLLLEEVGDPSEILPGNSKHLEAMSGLLRELQALDTDAEVPEIRWLHEDLEIQVSRFKPKPSEIGPMALLERERDFLYSLNPDERRVWQHALTHYHRLLGPRAAGPIDPERRPLLIAYMDFHGAFSRIHQEQNAGGIYFERPDFITFPFRAPRELEENELVLLAWYQDHAFDVLGFDDRLLSERPKMFHELAHVTERHNQSLLESALEAREVVLERGEYSDFQKTNEDADYATKVYDMGSGLSVTEMNTKALENLGGVVEELTAFAISKQTHFAYMMSILEGSYGYRK